MFLPEEDDEDDDAAPTPLVENNNDDDEPPAAGAVMVETEDNPDVWISFAPTAEPTHRAKPNTIPA